MLHSDRGENQGSDQTSQGERSPVSIDPETMPVERVVQTVQVMLDSLSDEVIQLDENGYVVTWNRGAEAMKGWTADEVLGQHVRAFYTDEDVRNGLAERELRVARETGRYETEGWRTRKDGSRFWASVVITPMRSPEDEFLGYVKASRDLSERRAQARLS